MTARLQILRPRPVIHDHLLDQTPVIRLSLARLTLFRINSILPVFSSSVTLSTEMTWWSPISLPATLLLAALSVQHAEAGNTTCVSRQLDWYTDVVGESPCMTYQRLRQICNSDYQVPSFALTVPGDHCDDQVSTCCCNTIAFQLSMLCLVCQQDHQDTGGIGTDAPIGSFDMYRKSCPPAKNHTLPDNLQRAVCNNDIQLDDFLYGGWDDGSWFYVWTRENAELDHASNDNNTFTHCSNQTSTSSTPTSVALRLTSTDLRPTSMYSKMASTTAASGSVASAASTEPISRGALIVGIVGGVLGFTFIVLAVAVWMWMRRRTQRASKGIEWSQNPRFERMYSLPQASTGTGADAQKTVLAQSKFGMDRPVSWKPSYRDLDISPEAPGRNNATAQPTSSPTGVQSDDKTSIGRADASQSRSFSAVYGTGSSQGSVYSGTHARSHSGAEASVSLSTFDFAGSQVPDDAQTTRSFPLSVATNGFATLHNVSRAPTYIRHKDHQH